MVLLESLIVGVTASSGASSQAIAATIAPHMIRKQWREARAAHSSPPPRGELMRRISFAGAMLTGFGALMLFHGGKVTLSQKVADPVVPAAAAEAPLAIMPSPGGMATATGIMLAGLGSRRPAS